LSLNCCLTVHQRNKKYKKGYNGKNVSVPNYVLYFEAGEWKGKRIYVKIGNAFLMDTWVLGYHTMLEYLMDQWNTLTERIQNLEAEVNRRMQNFFVDADLHFIQDGVKVR
jgi:hypothetical protein